MVITLPTQDYLKVSGPDAREFLQGLVTCNIQTLSPTRALRGALCNLKGRVIADFRAIALTDDILLQTEAGMAEQILATLGKYAVFSKVKLSRTHLPQPTLGFCGPDCAQTIAKHFASVPAALDDCLLTNWGPLLQVGRREPRFLLLQTAKQSAPLPDPLLAAETDPAHWHCAEICDGEVHVSEALSGEYTPQLLNYDISGVVDFQKGCYTGQEVVARMHYRGKAKQRMFLLRSHLQGDAPLTANTALCTADGSEYPDAILTAATDPKDSETVALAVLPVSTPDKLQTCGKQDQLRVETLQYT